MFRRTAISHAKACTSSSAKLDSSQTIHVPGSSSSTTSVSGRCSLPARTYECPAASNMAPRSRTTVVFPFVPVTPTIGVRSSSRKPSSTSLQIATPRARAAAASGDPAGTPGPFTTSSTPSSRDSSSDPRRTSTPSSASLPASAVGDRSAATTLAPTRTSAAAAARPVSPSPSTSTRPLRGTHSGRSSPPAPIRRTSSPRGELEGPCSDGIERRYAPSCRFRAGRSTSSGAAGSDPGLRAPEGQSLPGQAVEMRDERVDLGRLEGGRPAVAKGRLACGADRIEAHVRGSLVDRPELVELVELDDHFGEAGVRERSRENNVVKTHELRGRRVRLPFLCDALGEIGAKGRPVDGRRDGRTLAVDGLVAGEPTAGLQHARELLDCTPELGDIHEDGARHAHVDARVR